MFCFIVSMLTIAAPSNVYACSCIEPLTVEEQLSQSKAVFTGRVLKVKENTNLNGYRTTSALFEIDQIWKGGSESQIIIHTGSGGGDCGYHFEEGKEYLVYASLSTMYGDKEQLETISCDRTNILAQAQADLAVLGEGKVPTEQVNLEDQLGFSSLYVWAIVVGTVVIGMLVFFVWRKRRQ